MLTDVMKSGIVQLRTFVPAKDFAQSHDFYEALGFEAHDLGPQLTHFHVGRFAFLLQDFHVKEFADNLMMHMLVEDLDAWWAHISGLDLVARFGVNPPRAPKMESWGLNQAYLFDPTGVLWQIAADPQAES